MVSRETARAVARQAVYLSSAGRDMPPTGRCTGYIDGYSADSPAGVHTSVLQRLHGSPVFRTETAGTPAREPPPSHTADNSAGVTCGCTDGPFPDGVNGAGRCPPGKQFRPREKTMASHSRRYSPTMPGTGCRKCLRNPVHKSLFLRRGLTNHLWVSHPSQDLCRPFFRYSMSSVQRAPHTRESPAGAVTLLCIPLPAVLVQTAGCSS